MPVLKCRPSATRASETSLSGERPGSTSWSAVSLKNGERRRIVRATQCLRHTCARSVQASADSGRFSRQLVGRTPAPVAGACRRKTELRTRPWAGCGFPGPCRRTPVVEGMAWPAAPKVAAKSGDRDQCRKGRRPQQPQYPHNNGFFRTTGWVTAPSRRTTVLRILDRARCYRSCALMIALAARFSIGQRHSIVPFTASSRSRRILSRKALNRATHGRFRFPTWPIRTARRTDKAPVVDEGHLAAHALAVREPRRRQISAAGPPRGPSSGGRELAFPVVAVVTASTHASSESKQRAGPEKFQFRRPATFTIAPSGQGSIQAQPTAVG